MFTIIFKFNSNCWELNCNYCGTLPSVLFQELDIVTLAFN
jgi:hypothetical protein